MSMEDLSVTFTAISKTIEITGFFKITDTAMC